MYAIQVGPTEYVMMFIFFLPTIIATFRNSRKLWITSVNILILIAFMNSGWIWSTRILTLTWGIILVLSFFKLNKNK